MSNSIDIQDSIDMDDLYTDEDLDWEQRQYNLEAESLNDCDEEEGEHK